VRARFYGGRSFLSPPRATGGGPFMPRSNLPPPPFASFARNGPPTVFFHLFCSFRHYLIPFFSVILWNRCLPPKSSVELVLRPFFRYIGLVLGVESSCRACVLVSGSSSRSLYLQPPLLRSHKTRSERSGTTDPRLTRMSAPLS